MQLAQLDVRLRLTLALDDYRRQFETNVFGLLRTGYAALPAIEKGQGKRSPDRKRRWLGRHPGAWPYAMSKCAVRALANSITAEPALSGVQVILISPGFVASNIRRVDNKGTFHSRPARGADKAVRQILRAIAKGQREAIITGPGKALVAI